MIFPKQYMLILMIFSLVLLGACDHEDDDSNVTVVDQEGDDSDATQEDDDTDDTVVDQDKYDELLSALTEADFSVSNDSLDGVWAAVSKRTITRTFTKTIEANSYDATWDEANLYLYSLKESENGQTVIVSECAQDPEQFFFNSEFALSEDRTALEGDADVFAYNLEGDVNGTIESNSRIVLDEYYSEDNSTLVIGDDREIYSVSSPGVYQTTLVKISDSFDQRFGTVEINGEEVEVSCFFYEEGRYEGEGIEEGEIFRVVEDYQYVGYGVVDQDFTYLYSGEFGLRQVAEGEDKGLEYGVVYPYYFESEVKTNDYFAEPLVDVSFEQDGPRHFVGSVSITPDDLSVNPTSFSFDISF